MKAANEDSHKGTEKKKKIKLDGEMKDPDTSTRESLPSQTSEASPSSWRDKCIDAFGLQPLPENMESDDALKKLCEDEDSWEKYFNFRKGKEAESAKDTDDLFRDYNLEKKWKECIESAAKDLDMKDWFRHVNCYTETSCYEGKFCSTVFSPYAIPRAIKLKHYCLNKSMLNSVEFHCDWKFELTGFKVKKSRFMAPIELIGDSIQRKHAKDWPKGFNFASSPPFYDGNERMEILCSNEMVEPPYWGNAHEDNLPFHWFEKICVQNLTPLTIRRIKEWLFGGNNELPRAISDFKFARLLFAFFGTPNFRALQGSIGHSWRPRFSNFKEHKFEMPGDDDEDEDNHEYNTEVTWLEYQVRLVTSSLRDIDYYYEPFDEIFHKELWGEALIDARESRNREEMSHFRGINHEDLC